MSTIKERLTKASIPIMSHTSAQTFVIFAEQISQELERLEQMIRDGYEVVGDDK